MIMSLGKVAVALSGGAALGLAHVGALKAMAEFGVKPSFISGTSAGSVIGAMVARGLSVAEIEDVVLSIDRKKTFYLLSPSIPLGGLIDPKNFVSFMEKIVGKDTLIEDLEIPFVAVTIDFRNGNILYIDRGRLVDAIRSSISIPGVFKPFEANGTLLVDGGLRENLPLSALKKFNYDTLLGVNVLKTPQLKFEGLYAPIAPFKNPQNDKGDTFIDRISNVIQIARQNRLNHLPRLTYIGYQSLLILMTELSNREIQICNPDLVLQLNLSKLQLWEFWRGQEAMEIGYRESHEQLTDFFNR